MSLADRLADDMLRGVRYTPDELRGMLSYGIQPAPRHASLCRLLTVRNLGRVLAVVTSFVMWGPMGAAFSLGIILSTM